MLALAYEIKDHGEQPTLPCPQQTVGSVAIPESLAAVRQLQARHRTIHLCRVGVLRSAVAINAYLEDQSEQGRDGHPPYHQYGCFCCGLQLQLQLEVWQVSQPLLRQQAAVFMAPVVLR